VISGFHSDVDENYVLLGYYAASSGNPYRRFGAYRLSRNVVERCAAEYPRRAQFLMADMFAGKNV